MTERFVVPKHLTHLGNIPVVAEGLPAYQEDELVRAVDVPALVKAEVERALEAVRANGEWESRLRDYQAKAGAAYLAARFGPEETCGKRPDPREVIWDACCTLPHGHSGSHSWARTGARCDLPGCGTTAGCRNCDPPPLGKCMAPRTSHTSHPGRMATALCTLPPGHSGPHSWETPLDPRSGLNRPWYETKEAEALLVALANWIITGGSRPPTDAARAFLAARGK